MEYFISVNCELDIIKTLKLMCRLCDYFRFSLKLNV